jgi:hypothetical protein
MDSVESRLYLIRLHPVFREESLVGFIDSKAGLILVRQQFTIIFRSCCLEDLGQKKFVVCFNMVINIFGEGILGVVSSQN